MWPNCVRPAGGPRSDVDLAGTVTVRVTVLVLPQPAAVKATSPPKTTRLMQRLFSTDDRVPHGSGFLGGGQSRKSKKRLVVRREKRMPRFELATNLEIPLFAGISRVY